jgi:hypothetical protein
MYISDRSFKPGKKWFEKSTVTVYFNPAIFINQDRITSGSSLPKVSNLVKNDSKNIQFWHLVKGKLMQLSFNFFHPETLCGIKFH